MNNQNINPKTLKGREVFNRTLELMDKLTPINESVINASLEFIKRAPNGLVYTIIRENHKYFIKTTDKTEFKVSELDYIGGLKNKMTESYSSYEEALKHLNMKFQQINEMYGIKGGYNLFEQDTVETEDSADEEAGTKEKKYKLKVSSGEETTNTEPTSEPSPEPTSDIEVPSVEDVPTSPEGESLPGGEEMPMDSELPTPDADTESSEEPTDSEGDEDDIDIDEDEDPKKYIQKLTGRLGQKLRELSEVDPKLEKYVINSIISALHVDKMDKKDRMDVIRKFKKKKGMESMMKESYEMDEYYGMMSLEGPFNYEKISGGFDEDTIHSHSKSHRPLKYKKYEIGMDEELIGGQKKLDLNKNGRLDSEDFRMLRSKKKKKSSDEQWQGLAARAAGAALGSYLANKSDSDESEEKSKHLDREKRIEDAIRRVRAKRMDSDERFGGFDDIKFHSSKDETKHHDMDEMNIEELFKNASNEPDVMDPDIDIEEPLTPPVPKFPDPWNPEKPKVMPNPKAGKKETEDYKVEKDLTFESIIEKYRVKK